ncbi:MAG: hypothetical protein HOW73_43585 [Polyangiaceae bacterium]|nr:hypothetical protein [Polyangiaceae bacterium]
MNNAATVTGPEYLGDVLGGLRYFGQCPCGAQHVSTRDRVYRRGHETLCEACGRAAVAKASHDELVTVDPGNRDGLYGPVSVAIPQPVGPRRVPVKSVTILWAEGDADYVARYPREFASFHAADLEVAFFRSAHRKDHCTFKVGFRVVWEDGEEYEGRLDVAPRTAQESIGVHMTRYLSHMSCRTFPGHTTRERWEAYVNAVLKSDEKRAALASLLDGYDFGSVIFS